MFRGGVEQQIDDKGRIIVPTRFRELLSPTCFVTRGLHRCLFVFPWAKWLEIEERLNTAFITDSNAIALQRFFGTGMETSLDSQGRLTLPPALREYAEIKKDAFTLGANNRWEIWAKERWETYEGSELSLEAILQKAAALGF
jgi:MraZ protein